MLLDMLLGGTDNIWMSLLSLLVAFPVLLFSLSAHEFAHGFAAYKQGDGYAKMLGRLTLNPFKHLDPIGTLAMLLIGYGWAKPVPINPGNFKNGKKSMLIVSSAGIIANLLLAFIAVFLQNFILYIIPNIPVVSIVLYNVFLYLAIINLNLAVFNFIPIPPFDGYRIFKELFAGKLTYSFFLTAERYSTVICLIFILICNRTGLISVVSGALYDAINYLVHFIFIAFI